MAKHVQIGTRKATGTVARKALAGRHIRLIWIWEKRKGLAIIFK